MKRHTLAALASLFVVAAGPAFAAEPYGTWTRPSTGTTVNFYQCGGGLCAKIVGVTDASKKSTIGTVIMSGAKPNGPGKWKGSLLNTEDGKRYSGYVTMTGGGLHLEGCAAGIFCKGETWQRK